MTGERFKQLRDYVGYDNLQLARMLNIDVNEVEELCSGRKPIPDTMAKELEAFADWSSEVGDTTVKRDLAEKHLGKEGK
jgi:plasmid maintenance system antidote protein VapI